ncbi:MAG: peptidylprolyl isomerase [Dehalococcoidales bacterium]|nr:MAG: peptidylprolyl isomerase [Dehalococcoidales bacterium]
MSKSKRKRINREAERRAAEVQAVESVWSGKRIIITVSIIFAIIVAIIIGINHYFSEDQKYLRIDVISVDGELISMDYFVRRSFASGSDPMGTLTNMTREMVLKKEAEAAGIEISPEAVENKLIEMASGEGEPITQSEFKEWFRQRLNDTKLSDDEYRDIVATQLIGEFFYDVIADATPNTAEQVHLHVILTDTEEQAEETRARWAAGESFADLAREVSLDATSRENGGDVGWVPRGVIYDSRYDDVIFNLDIGDVSELLAYYDTSAADPSSPSYINYYLMMVSDKSDLREIDEKYLDTVHDMAFDQWISLMLSEHDIQYHGIKNGFDSETYAWINWQLQKLIGNK